MIYIKKLFHCVDEKDFNKIKKNFFFKKKIQYLLHTFVDASYMILFYFVN